MSRTKYILIHQVGYNPRAVEREVLDSMITEGEPVEIIGPISMTVLRGRSDVTIIDSARYFSQLQRDKEWKAHCDTYKDKRYTGTVRWFDRRSGTGYIELDVNGKQVSWPIYACNISGKRTWFPETACVYLEKGQVVECEVKPFYGGNSLLVVHTPGIPDEEKWRGLDKDRLAFRCSPETGEQESGLFK